MSDLTVVRWLNLTIFHPCCFSLQPSHSPDAPLLSLLQVWSAAVSLMLSLHPIPFPGSLLIFTVHSQLLLLPLPCPLPLSSWRSPGLRLTWVQSFREADTSKYTEPVPSCPSGRSAHASYSYRPSLLSLSLWISFDSSSLQKISYFFPCSVSLSSYQMQTL